MRKTLLILTLLISVLSFSQKSIDYEIDYLKRKNVEWLKNSPGSELRKASNHFYAGFSLSTLGTILYVSPVITNSEIGGSSGSITNIFSFGLILVGSFYMVESHVHVYRAGIILDERGVGLSIPIGKK
jgi:hypothetical protein